MIAVGSRGDVQPYVALGLGLRDAGHEVRIATHPRFEAFVRARALEFAPLAEGSHSSGAPESPDAAPPRRLAAAGSTIRPLRPWLELLEDGRSVAHRRLTDCRDSCDGSDAIVVSLLGTLLGYQLAGHLRVPLVRAYLVPWSPALTGPTRRVALDRVRFEFRRAAHALARQALWQQGRPWVNAARLDVLGLSPLPVRDFTSTLDARRTPLLLGYSPTVVPGAAVCDWADVTGFWFLDRPPTWRPPPALVDFLAAGPPPVFVGFGTRHERAGGDVVDVVLEALARAGRRGIVQLPQATTAVSSLRPDVLAVDAVPHDWLLPQVTAAVHHGGAGTTAAALRAGVPSIVVPEFADQPFWARRVHRLGVGPPPIPASRLSVDRLTEALLARGQRHRDADACGRAGRADPFRTGRGEGRRSVSALRHRVPGDTALTVRVRSLQSGDASGDENASPSVSGSSRKDLLFAVVTRKSDARLARLLHDLFAVVMTFGPILLALAALSAVVAVLNAAAWPWYGWVIVAPVLYFGALVLYLCINAVTCRQVGRRNPKPRHAVLDPGVRQRSAETLGLATAAMCYRRLAILQSIPGITLLVQFRPFDRLVLRSYSPSIHLGRNVINWSTLNDPDLTEIADNVILGGRCTISAHSMVLRGDALAYVSAPVRIEERVTIGGEAYVSLGCVVGRDAVVEPGAVVEPFTRIPPGEVWGGNPARFRRMREDIRRDDAAEADTAARDATPADAAPAADPGSERDDVRRLVVETLGLTDEQASGELSTATCALWDSLGQVAIAAALFDRFGVTVEPADIFRLESLDDIRRLADGSALPAPEEASALPGAAPTAARSSELRAAPGRGDAAAARSAGGHPSAGQVDGHGSG